MKNTRDILLTKEGKEKLEKELFDLREYRPHILEDLQRARAQGDLKENGAYQAARENLSNTDRRIVKLELTLRNSVVVEKQKTDIVQIGSTIEVSVNGKTVRYGIVGEAESDIKSGKISYLSPIARALLGQKKDATITVQTPGGGVQYTILSIQ